jgi:hypothetical protein
LLAVPAILACIFATTFAEVNDEGRTVRVRWWWCYSIHVAKRDVAKIGPSFLDGISVMELRRFVLPWGRVYFVDEWSALGNLAERYRPLSHASKFKSASGVEDRVKSSTPPIVTTLLLPIIFSTWVYFLFGRPPVYWLLAPPLLLVIVFMTTLAEVHDEGETVRVKRWWHTVHVAKRDVARIGPSFVDGISVVELCHSVFPWGRVYFVDDWSKLGTLAAGHARGDGTSGTNPSTRRAVRVILDSLAVAVFGFIMGRGARVGFPQRWIESSSARIEALALAAALCVVFAIAQIRKPGSAPLALAVATWIAGLVHW